MERFTRREFQTLLGAGLVSSCFVSLVALWQKLNHFSFASTEDGEATIRLGVPGTFDDSLVLSMVAGFFCIVAVIFVLRSRTTGERVLGLVSIAANLLSLKLALSRNGMFILVVGLCVFLIFRFGSWMKDRRSSMRIPVVMVFLPLFMVGSLWLLPADVYYRITSVFYLFSGSRDPVIVYNIRSTLGRFENYKSALKLFIENPVEGIGLGLYPYLTKFEDADGFYTGLLAETGLIGFLSFLVFAFLMLRSLYLSKSNYTDSRDAMCHELFFALTVALMLVSFFEPVFKIQVMTFYYFLLLKNYVSSSKEGYDEA
jgi:O-antigen ligase